MNWDRLLRWHLDPIHDPFPFNVLALRRREREEAAAELDLTGVEEPPVPWEEPPGSYEWPAGTAQWPEVPAESSHPQAPSYWPEWTASPPDGSDPEEPR